MKIAIADIVADDAMQARMRTDPRIVDDYAEIMATGCELPPVIVYGAAPYWLADGFHRLEAARRLNHTEISADVRAGDRRDAQLHAAGANTTHGLRRTNDDKRRAVNILLADAEWSKWSNRKIAAHCGVTHTFVNHVRLERESGNRFRRVSDKQLKDAVAKMRELEAQAEEATRRSAKADADYAKAKAVHLNALATRAGKHRELGAALCRARQVITDQDQWLSFLDTEAITESQALGAMSAYAEHVAGESDRLRRLERCERETAELEVEVADRMSALKANYARIDEMGPVELLSLIREAEEAVKKGQSLHFMASCGLGTALAEMGLD